MGTVAVFTRRVIGDLTDLDGRLLRTLRVLLLRPGQLTREYSEGRFRGQVAPGRLYLLSAAAYFLVAPLLGSGVITEVHPDGSRTNTVFAQFLWDSELALAALVPIWAVAVHAVLLSRKRYYEESFVFSVHYHVVFVLLMLVLAMFVALCSALDVPGLARALVQIGVLAPLPYLYFALRRAYRLERLRAAVTTAVLFISHSLAGGLLSTLIRRVMPG